MASLEWCEPIPHPSRPFPDLKIRLNAARNAYCNMKIYEDALKPTDTSLEDDQEAFTQAHDEKAKEIQHDKFLQKVTFFDLELVTDELESFRVQTVKKMYNQALRVLGV